MIINGGCANVVPPSGGPRDLQPPRPVEVIPSCGTHPNKEITIVFNEPITVHQQGKLFIQPTQQFKYRVKRNKLFISIDSLADSSFLYLSMVNFVKDITEGNILKSFTCLWHTYDTLYKPQITVLQMPFPQKISQFVATIKDSLGRELLHYSHSGALPELPPGQYSLIVWKDDHKNLKFDPDEYIGSKLIILPKVEKDTILISPQSHRLSVKTVSPFSAQIVTHIGGWDSIDLPVPFVRIGDTIIAALPDSQQQIKIRFYGIYDTAHTINLPARSDLIASPSVPKSFIKQDTALFSWIPITFPAPVINQVDSIIAIIQGHSAKLPVYWASPMQAILFLQKNTTHAIPLNQFRLKWGKLKEDTLQVVSGKWNNCAGFIITNNSNNPIFIKSDRFSFWLPPQTPKHTFECFPAVSISIFTLMDRNNDGRWNTGNHELLIDPERMKKIKTIKLEPGWEHKEIIK